MKSISQLSLVCLVLSFCVASSAQPTSSSPMVTLLCQLASGGTTVSFRVDLNAGIQKIESKPAEKASALIVNNGFIPNKIGLYIKGPSEAVIGQEFDLANTSTLSTNSKNADGSLNSLLCQVYK